MTRVSVIVPTYNGAQYLSDTLTAIGNQTYQACELLVVDDQSTDNSREIARAHPAVTRLIALSENLGVCGARNKGIDASAGDLIAFCDQDDIWTSNKLEAQVSALVLRPDIDYLFTNFLHLRRDSVEGRDKFSYAPEGWWDTATCTGELGMLVFRRPALPRFLEFQPAFPSTTIIRRSLLERTGQFNEALGRERSEDLEFLLRCESEARIAALPLSLVAVRKHDQNYSADSTKTTLSQIRILHAMTELGSRYEQHRDLIRREIERRSNDVIDGAFASGDIDTCLEMARLFPQATRARKQRIKLFIASLPGPVAGRLAAFITGIKHS